MQTLITVSHFYRSVLHSEGQCLAFHRLEATSDLDDNISISSGCELLHPLVFTRLFPTLITLYVLHHEEMDRQYQSRVALLKQMNNTQLMNVIKFPRYIYYVIVRSCLLVSSSDTRGNIH